MPRERHDMEWQSIDHKPAQIYKPIDRGPQENVRAHVHEHYADPDAMDVDYDASTGKHMVFSFSTEDGRAIHANRTKPVPQHGKKRLGAKKAKKLEIDANSSFVLGAEDATMYRALAARCKDLTQDRMDLADSSKELCR